jgi:hypothetical protein
VDINLLHGTAISSGFVGARAARLSKKARENDLAIRDLATSSDRVALVTANTTLSSGTLNGVTYATKEV